MDLDLTSTQLAFPPVCCCCGKPVDSHATRNVGQVRISGRVRIASWWKVPMCAPCDAHASQALWGGNVATLLFLLTLFTLGLGAPLLVAWYFYRKRSAAAMMGPDCQAASGPTFEPARGASVPRFRHLHPRFAEATRTAVPPR